MSREISEIDGHPLLESRDLASQHIPAGTDRRAFLMRNSLIGATAIMTGRPVPAQETVQRSTGTPPAPQLSTDLYVVKEEKPPIMATLDEFYNCPAILNSSTA